MTEKLLYRSVPSYALDYALDLDALARGKSHLQVEKFVGEKELLRESVPEPDASVLGASNGAVFSKRFHRFWFFKGGIIIRRGVASFANYKAGYSSPVGLFRIFRKEGASYSSKENPDPQGRVNMSYAIFLHALNFVGTPRGVAIHAGVNICKKDDSILYFLDSSKGCVHLTFPDARFFNQNLCALKNDGHSDRVLILPSKMF